MPDKNYRSFFNSITDYIFITDAEGIILHANSTVTEKLGYSLAELIKKPAFFLHPPKHRKEAKRILKEIIDGNVNSYLIPLYTRSGNLIPAETRVVAGEWGGRPAFFGVSKDLSDIKLAGQKYYYLFDLNYTACGISDCETGTYVEVNKAFTDLLGFCQEEAIGKTSTELGIFSPDYLKKLYAKIANKDKVINLPAVLKTKNGQIKHVLLSAENISIHGRKYRFTSVNDITTVEHAKQLLRKKNNKLKAALNELKSANTELFSSRQEITEREKALKLSEKRFRALFENLNSSFSLYEAVLDENGQPEDYRYLELNPEYERAIGVKAGNLIGRTLLEVFPATENVWLEAFKKVYITGVPARIEDYSKEVNKYFELIIYSPQEGQIALLGSDITERKIAEQELQKSRLELREVIEFSQSANYKRNLITGKYDYLSPVIEKLTGYLPDEFKKMSREETLKKVHPDDLPLVLNAIKEYLSSPTGNDAVEFRLLCRDGNYHWFSDRTVLAKDETGKPAFLFGFITNIDSRKNLEIKLKESENRLKIATDGAGIGLWDWNIKDGNYVYNEQWAEMLGYTIEELSPTGIDIWNRLAHPDDIKKSDETLNKVFSGELELYECEVRMKHKNGKWVWVLDCGKVIEWDEKKRPIRMAGTHVNINRLKKAEEALLHLSYHDKLTGLYNRTFFEEEKKRLDTSRQLPISVIMGDLNGLKVINDAFGHAEGDRIIKEASEIFKRACRAEDIIARWGGDEFVILLPKTPVSNLEEILERIKTECKKTQNQKIPLSISLGAATKESSSQSIDAVIIDSESNMYKNKLVEKESTASSIMAALEAALYEKSNETAEHTARIKELAIKLGKYIKLSSNQLDELSLLAALHDIGKVAIPEAILRKKSRLTNKEWEIVKRHPEIGFNVVQSSSQIAHVANAVLSCHEHWDGSGYPRGLKGESIPVTSRIILIADAFEVMTNGRTYEKPLSSREVIQELKTCAGTQFDPFLTERFIEVITDNTDMPDIL